jgi:hypothetical protein
LRVPCLSVGEIFEKGAVVNEVNIAGGFAMRLPVYTDVIDAGDAVSPTLAVPVEPEVLWCNHGIDALAWADAEPYADVLSPPRSHPDEPPSGEELSWLGRR